MPEHKYHNSEETTAESSVMANGHIPAQDLRHPTRGIRRRSARTKKASTKGVSTIRAISEKFSGNSTPWTDTGVDLNFQRDLGAINSEEKFKGKFVWTNGPLPSFQGNSYGPMALKVLLKFPPTLALVHGLLFPIFLRNYRIKCPRIGDI